jgi:hypothetical protein
MVDWALQVDVTAEDSTLARRMLDRVGAGTPEKGVRTISGMQRVHAHLNPLHRKAAVENFLAKSGNLFAKRQAQHAPLYEPERKTGKIKRREGRGV